MTIIRANGYLIFGCNNYTSKYNIYNEKKFPKDEVKTIICKKRSCPLSMISTVPKYSSIEYAPVYKNKIDLLKTRTFLDSFAISLIVRIFLKIMVRFILNKAKRKKFRDKYL